MDPGSEVRGGANGLENLKTGGGGGGGDYINIFKIFVVYISQYDIFQRRFSYDTLYLRPLYFYNILIKNRILKNFRGGARPVRPPLNPPLTSSLTEIEPHTAITNQPEESREKI